jgi:hypothetical protein
LIRCTVVEVVVGVIIIIMSCLIWFVQNCVSLPELPTSCTETRPDGNDIINIKAEEDDPLKTSFVFIKSEDEVSHPSISLYVLGDFLRCLEFRILSLISVVLLSLWNISARMNRSRVFPKKKSQGLKCSLCALFVEYGFHSIDTQFWDMVTNWVR